VVVELEVGLDVSDFAGLRLGEALVEGVDVGVERIIEERLQPRLALRTATLGGLRPEYVDVEVDEFLAHQIADDGHGERLLRGEVTDVLTEFHRVSLGSFGLQPNGTVAAASGIAASFADSNRH